MFCMKINNSSFSLWQRIHTGEKPFKCEICSRAFRQPGNLTRHRLTHTAVKPFVCVVCSKAFNRASNLQTHMKTHANFKPFVCPYCGKGFHEKINLKVHTYSHSGEAWQKGPRGKKSNKWSYCKFPMQLSVHAIIIYCISSAIRKTFWISDIVYITNTVLKCWSRLYWIRMFNTKNCCVLKWKLYCVIHITLLCTACTRWSNKLKHPFVYNISNTGVLCHISKAGYFTNINIPNMTPDPKQLCIGHRS